MRNSDLLEQLQQKDVTYVYNLSGHNVLNSLINLKQLTFEVTDACNLKCKYCGYGDFYETHGKREDKFLQFDVAKRLIDYLYDIWTNHQAASSPHKIVFGFYGGEPLMNMSLIEQIVAYLESLPTIPGVKYGYAMTTNGMLLDRYMSFLAEKEVMLLLSLDGDEYAQGYRVDHRGANSFQRVFHNMKLLQSTYPEYFAEHVSFNSVIHDKNNDVEVLKFIIEHFNKRPRLAELNNFGISEAKKEEFRKMFRSAQTTEFSCADSDFLYASSDVMDLLRLIDRLTDNVYYQYNSLLKKNASIIFPTGTCLPFQKKIFLTVNGDILPCERIDQKYILGHVTSEKVDLDLDAIAKQYSAYYNKTKHLCKACYMKPFCKQCLFYMENLSSSPRCPGFKNRKEALDYLGYYPNMLQQQPEIYARISKELMVQI